ncbi:MAG: type II secretion system GspH family protein [Burkholderiales bacterium]|nr:type II secretion system GspH family protein [Burkholderiales bacterium]
MLKKQYKKQSGFTMLETLIVLALVGIVMGIILRVNYSLRATITGEQSAKELLNFAKAGSRFVTTHSSLLIETLSDSNGRYNGDTVEVPVQLLIDEQFLPKTYPLQNKLHQYPCITITFIGQQLTAYAYYRKTSNSKFMTLKEQNSGANSIGSMLGLYRNGVVTGIGKDWMLGTPNSILVASGVPLDNGTNPSSFTCQGNEIADNSYVILMSALLNAHITSPARNLTALQSTHDDLAPSPNDVKSNNTMLVDMNMGKSPAGNNNALIFKINQACSLKIVESDPLTYGPYKDCIKKQLALQKIESEDTVLVTGFNQWEADPNISATHPKTSVGNLKVDTFQPTQKIAVGTGCSQDQLGAMALQPDTGNPNDVNNLYVSQVQCMVSPMCPQGTKGKCYLPMNGVSITYNVKVSSQDAYSSRSFSCPDGMFIAGYTKIDEPTPNACSGDNGVWPVHAPYSCHIDGCSSGAGLCSRVDYQNNLSSNQYVNIYKSITTTPSHWYQGCPTIHSGCNEGFGQVSDTYKQVTSFTCTNDPSKLVVNIVVN